MKSPPRLSPTLGGIAAAVFCCAALTSGAASAAISWKRVGTVTTLTNNQMCYTDGTSVVCDSNAPTLSSGNVGIGTASPFDTLTVNGTVGYMLGTDYTATGAQADVSFGMTSAVRYNGTAAATFYGIAAGGNGQILYLHNPSSYTLTLSNLSGSETTTANQIITGTGADLPIPTNTSVTLQYDATAAKWRVTGSSNSANTLAAGSTGQVQFNGGTNLAADSNLYWDNTNKRLGIGVASPQNLLTVNGAASIGYNVAAPTNGLIVNGNVGIGTNSAASSKLEVVGPNGLNVLSSGLVNVGGGTLAGEPATLSVNTTNTPNNTLGFIVGSLTNANFVVTAASATQIILTSGTSWTVPSNWNSGNNTIEVIGGGGGAYAYAGGGGGAYAKISNLSLTPGASVTYQVGAGGSGNGGLGGDTYFNGTSATCSAQSVCAKGAAGTAGGLASGSIGTVKYSGGAGYGGGGGAAGPNGNGADGLGGAPYTGGNGDNGYGGVGGTTGAGGNGTEWGTAGSGGGGGNSFIGGNYGGGTGRNLTTSAPGVIVITYSPSAVGVGVGTASPLATLDVEGGNKVILNAGNVAVGTTSASTALQVAGTVTDTGEAVTGNATISGNVAVGTASVPTGVTASVNGPVKVSGTGSEVCTSAQVGAIRYNPSGNYFELCSYP